MSAVIYNPQNKPVDELPVIYGFNNGGSRDWYSAVAIAEDGTQLGGHVCSSEGFMPGDLGMIEGHRQDRHDQSYRPHYPDGYRCEFVPTSQMDSHEKLNAAIAIANAKAPEEATA